MASPTVGAAGNHEGQSICVSAIEHRGDGGGLSPQGAEMASDQDASDVSAVLRRTRAGLMKAPGMAGMIQLPLLTSLAAPRGARGPAVGMAGPASPRKNADEYVRPSVDEAAMLDASSMRLSLASVHGGTTPVNTRRAAHAAVTSVARFTIAS